jgi:ABC-2 type transport system ATP-binding protein
LNAVVVENLVKFYGSFKALKGISFSFKEGVIYGLIGPNGAGKSTTLKIMATLLSPSDGRVSIFGYDVRGEPHNIRKIIGYLPEEAGG